MLATIARLVVSFGLIAFAATDGLAAEQGAPYFSVAGTDSVDRLPLLQTSADVDIVGPIAQVVLRQTFENRGSATIEANYVFPVSDRGAVSGLTMRIGDRVVQARLQERDEARNTYEAAKEGGRSAALLEQHDPGTFVMNLANILPGDRIEVELRYTELLVPVDGVYEFEIPNTFGVPHYSRPGDAAIDTPRSDAPEVTDYAFAVNARLMSGIPIASVESPSHHIVVEHPSSGEATLKLADDEIRASTRDFVLRFALAGNEIAQGLSLFRGADENFFLLMLQPPKAVSPDAVTSREYVFVVDVSGSMDGPPIEAAKAMMHDLLGTLGAHDRFNVVLFAGSSDVLDSKNSLPVGSDTISRAMKFVDTARAGGGTELVPALEAAYGLPHAAGMSRSIVIVSDGGIAAGGDVAHLIREHLDEANVFAFGAGIDTDHPVMRRLARAGLGEPFFAADPKQGAEAIRKFRSYVDQPLLTHVTVAFDGFDAYDVIPQRLPDLFAQKPVVLVGKYHGGATGRIRISGISGNGPYSANVDVEGANAGASNAPLRALWARERIADSMDDVGPYGQTDDAHKNELTGLSLRYGVATTYTAFIAVSEERRTDGTAPVKVQQPVAARISAGRGDAVANGLRLLASSHVASIVKPDASTPRNIAGKEFRFDDGVWTDTSNNARCIVLRIRRGSHAYEQLLALRPSLAKWFALGNRVLVRLGRYAVLIGEEGFSDYPADTLSRAARG